MKVKFLDSGEEFEANADDSVLDVAEKNGVDIDHSCGGNCACTTCHVFVEAGMQNLSEMNEDEEDLLQDHPEFVEGRSRLACQCKVVGDVSLRIPGY